MKPHLQIALALIWRGGEVLIAKRAADAGHLPDVWEFPGGKIEAGETPSEAAIREAREEIGLEVEIVGAREIIEWEYAARRVSLHPFDCRIVRGIEESQRFVAPRELRVEDFPAANAALIADLRANPWQENAAFTAAQLEAAMQVTQEFGPNRGIARAVRLLAMESHLSAETVEKLLKKCDEIERVALNLGGEVLGQTLSFGEAQRALQARFPMLSERAASTAINQGAYFAMK